jgi:branched-chain amino acid aminotransferase
VAAPAPSANLQGIDPSKLTITKTTTPASLVDPKQLVFGRTFTGTYLIYTYIQITADR